MYDEVLKTLREEKSRREKAESQLRDLQLRTEVGTARLVEKKQPVESLVMSLANGSICLCVDVFLGAGLGLKGDGGKPSSLRALLLPYLLVALFAFLIGRLMAR
jgi:hypothetical protein